MKIASYSIVHYGLSYLSYALRGVSNLVDHSYIFYVSHPSHGHSTNLKCPETRDEIMASIPANEWGKLTWVDTEGFFDEGPQRDYAVNFLINDKIDLILNLDYDEIWAEETLSKSLKWVWDNNNTRNNLINFRHMWRSFSYSCTDDGWPVRIIDTRHLKGTSYIPKEFGDIWHFGYAIKNETMKYKLSLHGHKDELRPNWYEEKWLAWPPPKDCHPTNGIKQNGEGWWDPVPFDKNLLPEIMKSHKWFNNEKIE